MSSVGEPVVIYRAANPQQAGLLRNWLENQGIAAWIQNDMLQAVGGDLPLGWTSAPQVTVRSGDATEARRLALLFDEQLKTNSHQPQRLEEFDIEAEANGVWRNWPRCPACEQKRHTRCPLCRKSSDQFALVDLEIDDDNNEAVLLTCDDCDEPFTPKFYRVCHGCGHDYGSGIEVASSVAPEENSRVWLMVGAIAVVLAAIGWYFASLFSG